jgi:hypothetical protein
VVARAKARRLPAAHGWTVALLVSFGLWFGLVRLVLALVHF